MEPTVQNLATLVNTRITQRRIGDFGFTAVGRSFDGAQPFKAGNNNLTFLGARPTRGVYQIDAMGELIAHLLYGAFAVPVSANKSAGELRIFSLGHIDERGSVLKTDDRPLPARAADKYHVCIGTYGANYVHVFRTQNQGQFDSLLWVNSADNPLFTSQIHGFAPAIPTATAIPICHVLSGIADATALCALPVLQYDEQRGFLGNLDRSSTQLLRSELHTLRLAGAQEFWYGGGGAFQSKTFGYTGRESGGNRSLANVWDVSLDVPLRYGFSVTPYCVITRMPGGSAS